MDKGHSKGGLVVRVVFAPFSSIFALGGTVVLLMAGGGIGYWYREPISSAYLSAWDYVLAALGLGVVPVALWLAVFLWALVMKRSLFRRARLWLSSLAFLSFVLGILAFFRPYDGALAAFTKDGEVSLGGDVGAAIAADGAWQGLLPVLGLFILVAALLTPRLVLDLTVSFGKLIFNLYVLLIVLVKRSVLLLRRMYRFEQKSSFAGTQGSESPPEARPANADSGAPLRASRSQLSTLDAQGLDEGVRVDPPVPPRVSDPSLSPVSIEVHPDTRADVAVGQEPATQSDLPLDDDEVESGQGKSDIGKFNRYWSGDTDAPTMKKELLDRRDSMEEDVGEDEAGAEPILDAMEGSWRQPTIDLLIGSSESGISEEEISRTGETIKRTLAEYGIEVDLGQIRPGPVVTMYGLIPGWVRRYKQVKVTDEQGNPKLNDSGRPEVTRIETKTRVKVDSITSREKDLSLALKTPSIRIETPVMGESLVGIEVPNPTPSLVTLRDSMESREFKKLRATANLPFALGKASGGETIVADLTTMPHFLIAGATGSGKSVCINTIVSSLIMEKTPAEMRLLLVDPKRVELTPYNGIPHLLTPVVVETDQVVALLKGLIREMLTRYRRMEEVGVRNIEAYNTKMPERMPYLVVVVDELADLMMSASFDVEQSLCRLAQLGRATGIHLIVATQRPSVDVVTGLIKANFPSRVSFGVASHIDSRTILDTAGAEKLLGRGDALYLAVDGARPQRVQGVYISDKEIEDLVTFWRTTPWAALPKVSLQPVGPSEAGDGGAGDGDEFGRRDELLDKAIELAQHHKKVSTSLLQRRMRVGYPRAARLMDQLEDEGVVGPGDGSKSRDVIMSSN